VVKQSARKNRDVVGGSCVKDSNGKNVVEEDKIMGEWRIRYEKLLNEEFPWNKE